MPLNRFIIPFNGVCGKKSRTTLLKHGSTVKVNRQFLIEGKIIFCVTLNGEKECL